MSTGVVVTLRVTPRAGRDAIEGVGEDGALRVRVTAAPVDGAANRAVLKLLARALGQPRSAMSLVSGATSRRKRVSVEGIAPADVLVRWPGASVEGR